MPKMVKMVVYQDSVLEFDAAEVREGSGVTAPTVELPEEVLMKWELYKRESKRWQSFWSVLDQALNHRDE